ncbi:MAG: hypothetical protein US52_C0011G0002 [candidate division WS6 bacterium GW2011_GWA2_37_6]|uniref:HTH cro/C1-type domain-containing protein n=1 Tax=candidate division WS6 bacterium GW2011_GWA2_37_6 TaxID=1619087 RepID=A0A0G0GYH2_9BACT|nr:MAG: hypothetical protein US52_C0011G0002 [candidate division WS6 bacterium GW2011_GWA2_37_6]
MDQKILGRRIKFFRERAHLSQLELETSIDASAGMISRIEKGRVNPTKETVGKIAEILHLHNMETDYLIGNTAEPPTQAEIDKAKNAVKDYFSKGDVFAYLSDDRWRVNAVSKGFYNLFKSYVDDPDKAVDNLIGTSIVNILLEEEYQILQFFKKENYKELLKYQLVKFHSGMGFMHDDMIYKQSMSSIERDPLARSIWEQIKEDKSIPNKETREIFFTIKGINIGFNYSKEQLYANPRFYLIEYQPKNKYLRIILKLLNAH